MKLFSISTLVAIATLACAFSGMSLSARAESVYATPYRFAPLAGEASLGSQDGTGNAARFAWPMGLTRDAAGNLYVADEYNHTIRKVTSAGVVTTVAGEAGFEGFVNGAAKDARFRLPKALALDAAGNLYVADAGNSAIRKITPAGEVSTLAGGQMGRADGTGSAAQFFIPAGIVVAPSGDVFVADAGNNTIRRITPAGVVTTFAGTGGVYGKQDGVGAAASFFYPYALALDATGTLFVTELGNYLVRKITADRTVTTLAGRATAPQVMADGTGAEASFRSPTAITLDAAGNLYLTDSAAIRKLTPAGVVTTIAATTALTQGWRDGPAATALFASPSGIVIDVAGDIYVSDRDNFALRKLTPAGEVSTLAGLPPPLSGSSIDAIGRAARFTAPEGAAVTANGDVYIADTGNDTIRRIAASGEVTTLAGAAKQAGTTDGAVAAARFDSPGGVAVDAAGNIFVADSGNASVRKISSAGVVTTFAGLSGSPGNADGTGASARFQLPASIVVDASGTLYVADALNHTVRKITSAGVVTTLAGAAGVAGSANGAGSVARFRQPRGLALDAAGNVFVADQGNHAIRKITPTGMVTTVAGLAGVSGANDGVGSAARFASPQALVVDAAGVMLVADTGNQLVRRITPAGVVTTVGGSVEERGSAVGKGEEARFDAPIGLALSAQGVLYLTNANTSSNTVVRGVEGGRPLIVTQPRAAAVTAGARAELSVVAEADPAPTYQWYLNGLAVAGATSSTLTLASAQTSHAGDYTVTVANSLGSDTSVKATLTITAVTPPPVTPPAPSPANGGGGGGGGGSPSLLFLTVLSGFGAWRLWSRWHNA